MNTTEQMIRDIAEQLTAEGLLCSEVIEVAPGVYELTIA